MAQKFSLKNAEQVRRTTTVQMQKDIKQMYENLYHDVTIIPIATGNIWQPFSAKNMNSITY
jgi:hypothetical protein